MTHIPPDWNEDRKLWDALGQMPRERPATDFAYRIRQKLQAPAERPARSAPWRSSLLWRWGFSLTFAAACLMLIFGFWPRPPTIPASHAVAVVQPANPAANDKEAPVEVAQLAQNYELIQDLDVIEHLDEL